jgi:hypothetical protein
MGTRRRPEDDEDLDLIVKVAHEIVDPDAGDSWFANAACRPEHWPVIWFFPRKGAAKTAKTLDVMNLCWSCPVRRECLAYALVYNEVNFGVWGGHHAKARMLLRRRLRDQLPQPVEPKNVLRLPDTQPKARYEPPTVPMTPLEATRRSGAADAMNELAPQERRANQVPTRENKPAPEKVKKQPRPVPPHGTLARYDGSTLRPPCRCDPCRQAKADDNRMRRARRMARAAAEADVPVTGPCLSSVMDNDTNPEEVERRRQEALAVARRQSEAMEAGMSHLFGHGDHQDDDDTDEAQTG